MQDQKNQSPVRSSMCSRLRWPTSLWHPFRTAFLCVSGKTNWKRVSYDSLGLACLHRIPGLSERWFCSHRNWLHLGESVCLDCHCPRVLSHSLEMTKLRVGSTYLAWQVSSKIIQAICWLSWTASRTCRLQLQASIGLVGLWEQPFAQLALLQLWPRDGYLTWI